MNRKLLVILLLTICSFAFNPLISFNLQKTQQVFQSDDGDKIIRKALNAKRYMGYLYFRDFLEQGYTSAYVNGELKTISELLNFRVGVEIFWHHVFTELVHPDTLGKYLKLGANPNIQDAYGRTALHKVSSVNIIYSDAAGDRTVKTEDMIRMATLLLEAGARLDVPDRDGNTPLLTAIRAELALFFLDHGANIHDRSLGGTTVLHTACSLDSEELVRRCLNEYLDVNATNKYGQTPLHFTKTVDIAKSLLDKGADVNARNNDGETRLHRLAQWAYNDSEVELIHFLLEAGADPRIKNNKGVTAVDMANRLEIKQILNDAITKLDGREVFYFQVMCNKSDLNLYVQDLRK